jgi:hypothetical protein
MSRALIIHDITLKRGVEQQQQEETFLIIYIVELLQGLPVFFVEGHPV